VKLQPFQLHRPRSKEEALGLLGALGDEAVVLAGGQSLIPALALRLAQPAHLIDINCAGCGEIKVSDGKLILNLLVRQAEALGSPVVVEETPLLADALAFVGHPETRSRGTVVGSIAHADPSAEIAAVALALDAEIALESVRGRRLVPAEAFFIAPFTTAKAPDELVTEVRFPLAPASVGWCFKEISRRYNDFALVAVAVTVQLDGRGRVADARLAYAGVGATPLRVLAVEASLRGVEPDPATLEEAAASAASVLSPPADVLASASYRLHAARILTTDALSCAVARAQEPGP
jgi:carbon-monoxide dehydrogenase medium subunit